MKTLVKFSAVGLLSISVFSCSEPSAVAPAQQSAGQHVYEKSDLKNHPDAAEAAM